MANPRRTKLTEKGQKKPKNDVTKESDMEKWIDLYREIGTMERPLSFSKNSVVIVGSGIQCISHLTLEGLSEIKMADDVFYCVADHVISLFIKRLRPDAYDLHVLYSDDKARATTFIQMTEACLHQARKGRSVCVILSGHPAMFSFICYRLVKIAKSEEYPTKVLASISQEDCLFSDLHIDPCFPGLQTFDATDYLLHNRNIDQTLHVIFRMVGSIGAVDCDHDEIHSPNNFKVLIRILQKFYGEKYEVVHYIPSQFSVCKPVIQNIPLHILLDNKNAITLSAPSMLYIPPQTEQDQDKTSSICCSKNVQDIDVETKCLKDLADWKVPENFITVAETELSEVLVDLSLNPSFVKLCEEEEYPRLRNSKDRRALYRKKSVEFRKIFKPGRSGDEEDEPEIRLRKPIVTSLKQSFLPKTVKPILRIIDGVSD